MNQRLNRVTVAASAIGYAVEMSARSADDTPNATTLRCVWRRNGYLSAGEHREITISNELAMDDEALVNLFRGEVVGPLIGEDLTRAIERAIETLAADAARGRIRIALFGGARDGETMDWPCDKRGFPTHDDIVLPGPEQPAMWAPMADTKPRLTSLDTARYRRGFLDLTSSAWRYDVAA